jgi:hypothetical protein
VNRILQTSLFFNRFFGPYVVAVITGVTSPHVVLGASTPIVDIDPSTQVSLTPGPGQYYGFNEGHGNGMIGWTFNLQQTLTVTAVGWYDDGKDGLSRSFQVGLWQDLTDDFAQGSTTQLLGSPAQGITIPGGTTASLQGSWRVVPLQVPLTLVPGNYELAGLDTAATSDVVKYVLADGQFPPPTIPGMTIQQFFYAQLAPSSSFQVVSSGDFYLADGLELGPMLFTNVPEPSTFLLLVLGVVPLRVLLRCGESYLRKYSGSWRP